MSIDVVTIILSTILAGIIPAPKECHLVDKTVLLSSIIDVRCHICASMPDEAYTLTVQPSSIRIAAGSNAGAFYALQTLRQEAFANDGMVFCGTIKDEPRFAWRGFMLDEARHFMGEEYVKKTLDLMAYFKMNKFHWHLTDNPGWRIEIKQYPNLMSEGAKRVYSDFSRGPQFYTQDQIRRIVDYATERHIEIIPEFDMPGHATSANRAYPELSGGYHQVYPNFTFNPGSEDTYKFIDAVLSEIASLFPSEYVHIGGDEVSFGWDCWKDNKDVQELMRRENLKSLMEVESYFMRRVIAMLDKYGKKLIGWDDILDLDIDRNHTAVTWFRSERPDHLDKAAAEGVPVVMSPRQPNYLDFVQYPGHTQGRTNYEGYYYENTERDMYEFPEKIAGKDGIKQHLLPNMLGVEACLWTETVANHARADYMIWPRLCAVAESGWTIPENKNYDFFLERLDIAYRYLANNGVSFFDLRLPDSTPEPRAVKKDRIERSEIK